MSLVCFDLSILKFTKVLGVMVPFRCRSNGCHRYLAHSLTHDSLFVPAAPAPYSSIGDRFNGQEDWGLKSIHQWYMYCLSNASTY